MTVSYQRSEQEQRYAHDLRLLLVTKKIPLQLGFSNPMLINKINYFAEGHKYSHTQTSTTNKNRIFQEKVAAY